MKDIFIEKLISLCYNRLIIKVLLVIFILIAAYIIHYTVTLSAFIEMPDKR
jgi:hypothetical protein